jgi:hypothetical protein
MDNYLDYFVDYESLAYFFGFVFADGHMRKNTRNRGCVGIEIGTKDCDILEKLASRIKVNSTIRERKRKTNFTKGKQVSFKGLYIYDLDFRNFLVSIGMPYGSKKNVKVPGWAKDNNHFWRGYVDGDGSLGITGQGFAYVSFLTSSKDVCNKYLNALESNIGIVKNVNRNSRDKVFNIMVNKEHAQEWVRFLGYQETDLCLTRKQQSATEVLGWVRPEGQVRVVSKRWNKEEDKVVKLHSISEAAKILGRTEKSIKSRAFRLKNAA